MTQGNSNAPTQYDRARSAVVSTAMSAAVTGSLLSATVASAFVAHRPLNAIAAGALTLYSGRNTVERGQRAISHISPTATVAQGR